jgi:nucleoside-diphosphate-sugar epimerase
MIKNYKKKKILITGAFGVIGLSLIEELRCNYDLVCLVRKTKKNSLIASKMLGINVTFGDLSKASVIARALSGCEFVIHLAFLDPETAELDPQTTYENNVNGTINLLNSIKEINPKIKIVFLSSIAAYFYEKLLSNKKLLATLRYKEYARQKIECEKNIKKSGLSYCILRSGAILPNVVSELDVRRFSEMNIPGDTKFQFICVNDLVDAIKTLCEKKIDKKTFLIGGGKSFRLHYIDFLKNISNTLSLRQIRKSENLNGEYYSEWFNTSMSQKYLNYQNRTFSDYLKEIKIKFLKDHKKSHPF